MEKINWFPGHMAKAISDLKSKRNQFDMLIEITDARAIKTSSNDSLLKALSLPVLSIALKGDLADNSSHGNQLVISTKNKGSRNQVINKIKEILKPKIDSKVKKGLINPQFNIVVVGLPNVGKSSFINFLLNKNNLIVQNRPGVTKRQALVKLDNMLYLNDSPGILFKDIPDLKSGYILGLIGCIKKEVLPIYEVIKFAYEYHLKWYKEAIYSKFKINTDLSFEDFLSHICSIYKFTLNENNPDINRAIDYLYSQFTNGKVCKVNYEKE